MRVLFIHNNYPGQFGYLVKFFISNSHHVTFLSSYAPYRHPNVTHLVSNNPTEDPVKSQEFFASSLSSLSTECSYDLIISHSGFLCGTFAKFFFPNTPLISYLEWWFSPYYTDQFVTTPYFDYSSSLSHKQYLRNSHLALELSTSDAIVSPTHWQCKYIPDIFKSKLHIIFDGVPNYRKLRSKVQSSYLIYATRGLEPIRCFPEFIKTIPFLRQSGFNKSIVIIGSDKVHYGVGRAVSKVNSFKDWAHHYLSSHDSAHNVFFLDKMPKPRYMKILSQSSLHVHLSQPFVPSWSLFDSISLANPILYTSNSALTPICSTSQVAQSTSNTFNPEALAQDIQSAYRKPYLPSHDPLFWELYGITSCLQRWHELIQSLI